MTRTLENRVAIVTGAASGIGAATASLLAERGAKVCCADLNEAGAKATSDEIARNGGEAFSIEVDVSAPEQNERIAEATVERYGAVHIAVLNAGVPSAGTLLDISPSEWHRTISINLSGAFYGLQSCGRRIAAAGGGAITLTSSAMGILGTLTGTAYGASKHGVLGLMKSAAVDLAPHGIRVNAVCPGTIDTPILGPLHDDPEMLAKIMGPTSPSGRVGCASEIAEVIAFLVSDAASFMTASTVCIDGGMTSTMGPFGTPGKDIGTLIGID